MNEYRVLLLIALVCAATSAMATGRNTPLGPQNPLISQYGKLPLSFEPNQGQTDSQVQFVARGAGYTLFLTPTDAVLSLRHSPRKISATAIGSSESQDSVIRVRLLGVNAHSQAQALEPLPGRSNYFIGNDRRRWQINVPQYAKVRFRSVYPGVDLVYYGHQGQIENDFVVSAGSDAKQISFQFEGAEKMEINAQGDLLLHFMGGEIKLKKPVAYQLAGGGKTSSVSWICTRSKWSREF